MHDFVRVFHLLFLQGIFCDSSVQKIRGSILQHNCQPSIENLEEPLRINNSITVMEIQSPACKPELLNSRKFNFVFPNENSPLCSVTTYCADMMGSFCDNYDIAVFVRKTDNNGGLNSQYQEETICNRDATYLKFVHEREEMVIEVDYGSKPLHENDVFRCGIYYKCDAQNSQESLKSSSSEESEELTYRKPGRSRYPNSKPKIRDEFAVIPYLATSTATLTVTSTKKNLHIPKKFLHYLQDDSSETGRQTFHRESTSWPSDEMLTQYFPPEMLAFINPQQSSSSASVKNFRDFYDERFSLNCETTDGRGCASGAWKWSEGPDNNVHFVNCIPMTLDGRNVFDVVNTPNAEMSKDFDYFCPTSVDGERKINRNQENFFDKFSKCRVVNVKCLTNTTLEQQFSPQLKDLCRAVDGSTCSSSVWRDDRGRWYRGCRQVGRIRPRYECATSTNNVGRYISIGNCATSNPSSCISGIDQLAPLPGGFDWVLN